MDNDECIQFTGSVLSGMSRRAYYLADTTDAVTYQEDSENDSSPQKQVYDEAWSFFYGVSRANTILTGAVDGYDMDAYDKHCDKYGYGAYGEGLELGRRLTLYNDSFELLSGDADPDSNATQHSFELSAD